MSDSLQQQISNLEARVQKLELVLSSGTTLPKSKSKKISAKEFMLTKVLKADVQRVLALCYYLEQNEEMKSFNIQDIETVFRLAKVKLPSNINDAVNKNIGKGFMQEANERKDGKKAWELTMTGESFVETELSK